MDAGAGRRRILKESQAGDAVIGGEADNVTSDSQGEKPFESDGEAETYEFELCVDEITRVTATAENLENQLAFKTGWKDFGVENFVGLDTSREDKKAAGRKHRGSGHLERGTERSVGR